jgi:hypothetical protein
MLPLYLHARVRVLCAHFATSSPRLRPFCCELICEARKQDLDAQMRPIGTTGKSAKSCPARFAKIFRLTYRPNQPHIPCVSPD